MREKERERDFKSSRGRARLSAISRFIDLSSPLMNQSSLVPSVAIPFNAFASATRHVWVGIGAMVQRTYQLRIYNKVYTNISYILSSKHANL